MSANGMGYLFNYWLSAFGFRLWSVAKTSWLFCLAVQSLCLRVSVARRQQLLVVAAEFVFT